MKKHLLLIVLMALASLTATAQTKQQADSLHQLGRTLLNDGKTLEGRHYTKQALDMRQAMFGELNEDYITSLNNYALSFTFGDDIDMQQAIKLQQQVMQLCDQLQPPHPDRGRYALNMGRMYYITDDTDNAAKYWEQALASVEKHGEMYEKLLEWLGMVYSDQNDIANMERIMRLTQEHNEHELLKPCNDTKCMTERGQHYASVGDNANANEWFLKAVDIAKGEEKAEVLEAYGKFLGMNMNDYASGAEYMMLAAKAIKETEGEGEAYYKTMNTAGIFSFLGRQYQQAVDCYLPVVAFYQQYDSDEAKSNVAKCRKNLGNAYSALKDYGKAKECFRQAVDYYATYDPDNEEYPKLIARLASAEKFNKDYDDAIGHYMQALALFEERGMTEDYSSTANALNLCYAYAGRDERVDTMKDAQQARQKAKLEAIIKEEKDGLQITHDYLGQLRFAHSIATIAGCYASLEEYDSAVAYYNQYMPAARNAIRYEFQLQNESQRMVTWKEDAKTMQYLKELLVTLPVGNDALMGDLTALVYDADLLSKGILLNSSIEFEKVVAEKGDATLRAAYEQSKANEEEIQRLRNNASSEADLEQILQLTQQNQQLQLRLSRDCHELADFTDYIAYTWRDVQNALADTDVAIEFVAIKESPIDSENYMAALVLTQDMDRPLAVPVCTLAEVKVMATFEQLFELDGMVWGNIGKLLEGKSRIFFSADGGFNHIAIEYLLYNGKPLSEQFEVYRLSSTKELCYHRQAIPLERIALFGDINYNAEGTVSAATRDDLLALRGIESGFINLGNTKREVNEIEAIFSDPSHIVTKLTDTEASQTAFLNLSGTKVNLIHIATHGAYLSSERQTDTESMQNSILAFAGANLYDDTHDGILSAADIAKMNLRECDLAVLSACETGLGKLSDDGVFGLQRGFKNAGVRSLLMSTKSVYDNTTADMMVSFYRHLTEGLSKRQALVKAQQEVRDKGFTDAKYWATFILLDGLE